jgi:hypothetical protein
VNEEEKEYNIKVLPQYLEQLSRQDKKKKMRL